jgi:glutamyl-tRNA reductase
VIGESQVLGQVRDALRGGQDDESVGPLLNGLFQQALRVAKRAHSETDIDHAGQSMVSVALDAVERENRPIAGRQVAIIGAGSMAALAVSTLRRLGVTGLTVLNRTPRRAGALTAKVDAVGLDALPGQLRSADLVVSCTGAVGVVVTDVMVRAAMADRTRPLTIVDLALPHDVDRSVADIDGVSVVGLAEIAERASDRPSEPAVDAVRQIVGLEVAAYRAAAEQASIAPTVVALRTMATTLVGVELDRLWNKLGPIADRERAEIEQTVRRVADKLLHEPTVRVKQLGGQVPSATYAAALAELFALDPAAIKAVTDAGEAP